jgi:hypothetical protein
MKKKEVLQKMSKSGISYQMTAEQFERIVQAITNLDAELEFSVGFGKEEHKKYQKMGDKTVAFITKMMEYSTDHPDLVPPYSDINEFKTDYDLASKLRLILEKIDPVVTKINDSYLSVGDDVFSAARKFYGYVKAAAVAGAPGLAPIASELGKRYTRSKASSNTVPPVNTVKQ